MMAKDIPPCNIRIDKEGNWYYQGAPIINKKIYLHLNQCLDRDSSGRYILSMEGERCYLEVEDTPFVIQEVAGGEQAEGNETPLTLKINDGTEETLDARTLRVGKDNVLYCKIKGGKFEARFLRSAYYQLARFLEQEGSDYYLRVGDSRIRLEQL